MRFHHYTSSIALISLASATINRTDVNDIIVVDQLDPDRLKGVWFDAIVPNLPVPETCTVYEFGSLYKKRNQVLFNTTKMFRAGLLSPYKPGSLQYAHFVSEVSPTEKSTFVLQPQDTQNFLMGQEAVMHRIGVKQYHRVDNEFLIMYGTFPVSVLVRYPDFFEQKYAATVLRSLEDRGVRHIVHTANYSECHYSPFSAFKLPEDLLNGAEATTDSVPDVGTPMTENNVVLGIEWLTTDSYRDAIVEITDVYIDSNPETDGIDSYAVEDATSNGYQVTDLEATIENSLDNDFADTTPDGNPESSIDGATTLS